MNVKFYKSIHRFFCDVSAGNSFNYDFKILSHAFFLQPWKFLEKSLYKVNGAGTPCFLLPAVVPFPQASRARTQSAQYKGVSITMEEPSKALGSRAALRRALLGKLLGTSPHPLILWLAQFPHFITFLVSCQCPNTSLSLHLLTFRHTPSCLQTFQQKLPGTINFSLFLLWPLWGKFHNNEIGQTDRSNS